MGRPTQVIYREAKRYIDTLRKAEKAKTKDEYINILAKSARSSCEHQIELIQALCKSNPPWSTEFSISGKDWEVSFKCFDGMRFHNYNPDEFTNFYNPQKPYMRSISEIFEPVVVKR